MWIEFPLDCLVTEIGQEYAGDLAVTFTRATCVKWSDVLSSSSSLNDGNLFPDASVADAENFCRNPDKKGSGPWCYTSLSGDWESCGIIMCEGRLFSLNLHNMVLNSILINL